MKKKIFAITLCALIAAASIVGSTGVVDNSECSCLHSWTYGRQDIKFLFDIHFYTK